MCIEYKENELALLISILKNAIEKTLKKVTYIYNKDLRGLHIDYNFKINNQSLQKHFNLQNTFNITIDLDELLEDTIKIKVTLTKFDCEEITLYTYSTNLSLKDETDYDIGLIRSQIPIEWNS